MPASVPENYLNRTELRRLCRSDTGTVERAQQQSHTACPPLITDDSITSLQIPVLHSADVAERVEVHGIAMKAERIPKESAPPSEEGGAPLWCKVLKTAPN